MLFSSWKFLCLFLPLTLAIFFILPARVGMARKGGLLFASFVFYGAWKISALPLLCGSILFNFWVGEFLVRWKDQPRARLLMIIGVLCNLGLLGYYKYAGFTVGILQAITQRSFVMPQIILPLAISFFTFTQIAYIIDVYRDHTRHYRFWDYVLFVVMFPHLIAGPIVRHWEIIPQYAGKEMRPSLADLHAGTILFLMGLFKKVLIADPLAVNANAIYDAAATGVTPTFFDGWFGTLCYALQLYFDFSGYSDMAIGLARMFGIRFPCNFNSPYRSLSISEFWSRWHITLTRFLREYVYFPLGGNRAGEVAHLRNIMAVMLLSGLWHGAGWTFVCWGGLHGIYLVIASLWKKVREDSPLAFFQGMAYRRLCGSLTFLAVLLAWVLFRAKDFPTAGRIYASMSGIQGITVPYKVGEAKLAIGKITSLLGGVIVPDTIGGISYRFTILWVLALLLVVWVCPNSQQLLARFQPILEEVKTPFPWQPRFGILAGLLFGTGLFFVFRSFFAAQESPFLYFNF